MKTIFLSIQAILFLSISVFAQTQSSELENRIATLEATKNRCESRLVAYEMEIQKAKDTLIEVEDSLSYIKRQLTERRVVETMAEINKRLKEKPVTVELPTSSPYYPDADNGMMTALKKGAKVTVIGIEKKYFFKVKYKGKVGVINGDYLDFKGSTIEPLTKLLIKYYVELGEPVNKLSSGPASDPVVKYAPSATPSYQSSGSSSGQTGKTIYTGPRGGKYHYSASGKKVYEKKKRN